MRTTKLFKTAVVSLAACGLLATAPAAMASGGGGGVTKTGACSGAADWKLGLRPQDNNTIEVQLEVENALPGQAWAVRMNDNGIRFFAGSRTANSLGRFRVKTTTANQAGSDSIVAKATNKVTGEVCKASATL